MKFFVNYLFIRDASRFLDDELGADVPVQIERREKVVDGNHLRIIHGLVIILQN